MPYILHSTYRSPIGLRNGHIQTIVPALLRPAHDPGFIRERIFTQDGDFLDLDWLRQDSSRLAVLCHGLEGSSRSSYMCGMAQTLFKAGWDVLAWNYRSCSGEMNWKPRFYHSGDTLDLDLVVRHALQTTSLDRISLVGFSLGGNVVLKYVGEADRRDRVQSAVAISTPCDLRGSAMKLASRLNAPYMRRFMRTLRQKIAEKSKMHPALVQKEGLKNLRTFLEFDDAYTAPLHGFKDAEDYWAQSNSKQFLSHIQIPTLILNARNDPFLSETCFPFQEAECNSHLFLETPLSGGHVGFMSHYSRSRIWSELRAEEFLRSVASH